MARAITLRERFAAEEELRQRGLDEPSARRLGGWLVRLRAIAAAIGRHDPEAVWGGAIDPAALEPELLHAYCTLLSAVAPSSETTMVALATAWAELGRGPASRGLRGVLAERAGVPVHQRDAVDGRIAAMGVHHVAARAAHPDGAQPAIRALRTLADGGPVAVQTIAAASHRSMRSQALAALDRALDELDVVAGGLDAPMAARIDVLSRASAISEGMGGDLDMDRRLLERWLTHAWRSYTLRRWDELTALLRVVAGVIDRLVADLESRPDEMAYRASVAQALVFRSEMAPVLAQQIDIGERALALCPTLRNARVVLAAHLADRGRRTGGAPGRRDAERALELDPHSTAAKKLLA